jgi:hypothetical protein
MKKQTAVEWLQEAISKKLSSEIGPYFLDLFEQAKAMEKEQIIDAWKDGVKTDYAHSGTFELYYTQTFTQQPHQ